MKLNLFLALVIVSIISAMFQLPDIQPIVIWNKKLIVSGEWWRIVTGNFTHTNLNHFMLNIASLWIISFVFRPTAKSLSLLLGGLSFIIGFVLIYTDMGVYAGLSGVLHGIFAYYALGEVLNGRLSSLLLTAGVIVKVGYEQLFGASESTAELIGARVAIDAHLFGCIAGLCYALGCYLYSKQKSPPSVSQ